MDYYSIKYGSNPVEFLYTLEYIITIKKPNLGWSKYYAISNTNFIKKIFYITQ